MTTGPSQLGSPGSDDPTSVIPRYDEAATATIPAVADVDGGKLYPSRAWMARDRRRRSGGPVRTTLRVTGELLITCGLVLALFAVYELYGKTVDINNHQQQLEQRLDQAWDNPPTLTPVATNIAEPRPGRAVARLWIPKLNKHWVVVEGVALKDIRYAPGHYPGTAMPGQIGNFAVAGHRVPAIFWDLDKIHKNDVLVVETADNWYVYRVTVNEIVTPHSVQVIAPTPDEPSAAPTQAMMTLTTCNPRWDNYQRMVIHAKLVWTVPHSAGSPVPLGS